MGGTPNSASELRSTAGAATGGVAPCSDPFRSGLAASARSKRGGLVDDSLRLPRAAEDGAERGELPAEEGRRTPLRGVLARPAAPLIRVRAGGAAQGGAASVYYDRKPLGSTYGLRKRRSGQGCPVERRGRGESRAPDPFARAGGPTRAHLELYCSMLCSPLWLLLRRRRRCRGSSDRSPAVVVRVAPVASETCRQP